MNPEVVGSIPAKTPKTENSNLHKFEVHRPSSKGTKLLFHIIKAIINQYVEKVVCVCMCGYVFMLVVLVPVV